MVFDTISNSEGCFMRCSEAQPTLTLNELATAFVKLQLSVNRILTG